MSTPAKRSRWAVLESAMLTIVAAGTVYAFGVYSSALRKKLHISQTALEISALASNLGNYNGIAGFVVDRFGSVKSARFGAYCIGLGYAALWALTAYSSLRSNTAAAAVSLCNALWGFGSGLLDVSSISVSVKLFPDQRGRVVGVLKSLYGLASSLIVLFAAYLVSSITFIGVLAFLAFILPLVNAPGLAVEDCLDSQGTQELHPSARFDDIIKRIVILAFCTGAVAVAHVIAPAAFEHSIILNLAVAAAVAFGLFYVSRRQEGPKSLQDQQAAPLLPQSHDESLPNEKKALAGTQDSTPGQALQRIELWLALAAIVPTAGQGLMVINNSAQILSARGASSATQSVAVAMISVANCLGRLCTGFAADRVAAHGKPRTVLLVLAATLGAAAMMVLYISGVSIPGALIGVILAGGSYGALWTLLPTITSDLFGLHRFASNYMLCLPFIVLASLLFSTVLAASVYSAHSNGNSDDDDDDGNSCTGAACFELTYLITAISCLFGAFIASFLVAKTAYLYELR